MLRIVTGLILLVCSILTAQPHLPSRSSMGVLSGQQFVIEEHVRLSVGYSSSGLVCDAVIAPPDYDANHLSVAENAMDSNLVDQVLDVILPGILTDKTGTGFESVFSRNRFLNQDLQGAHVTRHYVSTNEGERTVVATLQVIPPCRGSNVAALQAHYGSPQVEEFSSDGNISIAVRYGANQIPWRIDFTPTRSPGSASSTSTLFNTLGVEHWINVVTLRDVQSGKVTHHVTSSGSRTTETEAHAHFSIERKYQEGALVKASVTWN